MKMRLSVYSTSFGVQQGDKIGIVGINGTGARVKIRLS